MYSHHKDYCKGAGVRKKKKKKKQRVLWNIQYNADHNLYIFGIPYSTGILSKLESKYDISKKKKVKIHLRKI